MKKRIQSIERFCGAVYKIQYARTIKLFGFIPITVWDDVLENSTRTNKFGEKYQVVEPVVFGHAERAEYVLRNTPYEELVQKTQNALKNVTKPIPPDRYKYIE